MIALQRLPFSKLRDKWAYSISICMLMHTLIFSRIAVLAFKPKKPLPFCWNHDKRNSFKRSNFDIGKIF